MLTVPQAARRIGRHPETVRRWIRSGRLQAQKIGTQHFVEESDLAALEHDDQLPLPAGWQTTRWDGPMPNNVRAIWEARRGR
ncbi:MAG TPA: helix-turn-helix domain-containing protein [Egibacteraceae bacterium]|nr:helix-turn-helix domain-containing protein [Actinomycetota bacterium]HWB72758.1 helix-turn-helix domain-containing protein [Egibacteraceae bacterium]